MKNTSRIFVLAVLLSATFFVFTNCKKDSEKTDPIITWNNPADISYGTLLSNIQLNATANVEGIFVYTPTIGTKLTIGASQDLKVDFIPTDATTFNSVSKTVKINITDNPKLFDNDGNVYNTITIGTQTWMAENLRTTKYNDNSDIRYNERWEGYMPAGYCWYQNDVANKNIYGALYSWYAVNTGKLAPTGWHVPTKEEWKILEDYLIANGYNYDGTTAVNKIAKSLASAEGWNPSTNSGAVGNPDYAEKRNSSGFMGIPVGRRFPMENMQSGAFSNIGYEACWWSSSRDGYEEGFYAYCYTVSYNEINSALGVNYKEMGHSIRCIKD
jgi:uncharacterized protein (TIGR02145 family)